MFKRFRLWFVTCPTQPSATPIDHIDVLASIKFSCC